MRELYEADVGPITAYAVHGIRTNFIKENVYEKIAGFIGLALLHLMVACSSVTPQWQPTAVTDFSLSSVKTNCVFSANTSTVS